MSSLVPKCPIGMQYSECTKSCSTTCHSLNIQEVCKEDCVDGCRCPGNFSLAASRPLCHFCSRGNACVFQWVRFWTGRAVWKYPSVPACTWADISHQDPPSLRTATPGETTKMARKAQTLGSRRLNCNFLAACVAMVPGNAPMKAALVNEMDSFIQRCPLFGSKQ